MQITAALRGEHGAFYPFFDRLEAVIEADPPLETILTLADVLAAALVTHATLENDLLLDAMDARMPGAGPVQAMWADHEAIEGALARVPQDTDPSVAGGRLQSVIDQARAHFEREERVLFPIAEQNLDVEVLESLGREWAERRRVALSSPS